MAKSLIPKSKAKTAYGLLSEIAALALDEPKRMRMGLWGGKGAAKYLEPEYRPACGTVGCIGGWTNVLKPRQVSQDVLGIHVDQVNELFFNDALCMDKDQGTPKHARRVASHIASFQKKYRAQLLAKKV